MKKEVFIIGGGVSIPIFEKKTTFVKLDVYI